MIKNATEAELKAAAAARKAALNAIYDAKWAFRDLRSGTATEAEAKAAFADAAAKLEAARNLPVRMIGTARGIAVYHSSSYSAVKQWANGAFAELRGQFEYYLTTGEFDPYFTLAA